MDRSRGTIYLLAATALMAVILTLPLPEPIQAEGELLRLTAQGKAALAVLAFAVTLWATEAISFPVTGLLAMVMVVLAGGASFSEVVAWGFGNSIILFLLGVLLFSVAVSHTPLLNRLTLVVLKHLGHSPRLIVLAFVVVGAMLSGWITDMAVAAMLMPIAVSILHDAGARPMQSNFGKSLLIACAWGPLIGGVSTPAGCGPNPLTMQYLKELAGMEFSFADWMLIGFPATILMIPCGWLILIKTFPPEPVDLVLTDKDYRRRLQALGRFTRQETVTLVVFALMVFLWLYPTVLARITDGHIGKLDIGLVAIGCSCLFFLPGLRVITWKQAESNVSWGAILLIVAGLALGKTIHATGAAGWLAYVAFHQLGLLHPVLITFAVVFGVSVMKVLFSSNTVTGAIMVPLLIALAQGLQLDPALVAVPAGITASLAFILVTSTPTNVIPHSAGYFSIADMAKAGAFMTVASSVAVTISIGVFGRLFGIVQW